MAALVFQNTYENHQQMTRFHLQDQIGLAAIWTIKHAINSANVRWKRPCIPPNSLFSKARPPLSFFSLSIVNLPRGI